VRRSILVAVAAIGLFLFSIPSFAQEVIYPKAEVFGGFSISSAAVSSVDPTTGLPTSLRETFWGWQGSANFNVAHHLAIVGDFGGQYKSLPGITGAGATVSGVSLNSYQFLFGPRVMWRKNRVTPFVHAMFGGVREGVGSTTLSVLGVNVTTPAVSSTGLGMGIGGGFDVNLSDHFALRVPQFDWTPMHVGGIWESNVIRIGIGLVVKAGGK
jgi:hypothetical protein